jgi:hypothetical protein
MSARNDGQIRIGCGRHDWYFKSNDACRVEKLVIAIDVMKVLAAVELAACMDWLSGPPYPWCTPDDAVRTMPASQQLAEIEA